jgi:two-component system copper resistance phosphate regulon response regulator CusR
VLVVEDEEKIAQFLKKGLTEKGYTVEVAGDADTALARLESAPADLLILDLLLRSRASGFAGTARGVRAKILMLTARDTVENKIEGPTPAPTITWSAVLAWSSPA